MQTTTTTRICSKCKREQPLDNFAKGNKYLKWCNDCRERARKYGSASRIKRGSTPRKSGGPRTPKEVRRETTSRNRRIVTQWKVEQGCKVCGNRDARCLVLHHRDPVGKRSAISSLYHVGLDTLRAELHKCDVLCANCHATSHWDAGLQKHVYSDNQRELD